MGSSLFAPTLGSPTLGLLQEGRQPYGLEKLYEDSNTRLRVVLSMVGVELPVTLNLQRGDPTLSLPTLSMPLEDQSARVKVTGKNFTDGFKTFKPSDPLRPNMAPSVRLSKVADVTQSLPVTPNRARRVQRSVGQFEIISADKKINDFLYGTSINGQPLELYLGPARAASLWSEYVLILSVLGKGVTSDGVKSVISVQEVTDFLNTTLFTRYYTGKGGDSGDPELAERPFPITLGQPRNIEPVLKNKDVWLYQFSDGPSLAIDAVKEGGVPFTWDGNDYPTTGSLRAATVAPGTFTKSLVTSQFRVGIVGDGPEKPITADVRGEVVGTAYTDRMGPLMQRAALYRAQLPASLFDNETFNNLPIGKIGYYNNGQTEITVAGLFDRWLRMTNGWYGSLQKNLLAVGFPRRPEYQAYLFPVLASGIILDIDLIDDPYTPIRDLTLPYGRNWRKMQPSEISLAAPAEDAAFYAKDYEGEAYWESGTIANLYAGSESGGTIESDFVEYADALETVNEVGQFLGANRRAYQITTTGLGLLYPLNSYVRLQWNDFGLEEGKNCWVQSRRIKFVRGNLQVEFVVIG